MTVFYEIVSDIVHLDIIFVAPTPERNCHTLLTCGMVALHRDEMELRLAREVPALLEALGKDMSRNF